MTLDPRTRPLFLTAACLFTAAACTSTTGTGVAGDATSNDDAQVSAGDTADAGTPTSDALVGDAADTQVGTDIASPTDADATGDSAPDSAMPGDAVDSGPETVVVPDAAMDVTFDAATDGNFTENPAQDVQSEVATDLEVVDNETADEVVQDLCIGVNCDDGNACTADPCDSATGQCSHDFAAADTICDKTTCNWGTCKTPGNCVVDGSVAAPMGTKCGLQSGKSGFCTGQTYVSPSEACAECLWPSDCPVNPSWDPQCWDMKCTNGMCDFYNYNSGEPCNVWNQCMSGPGKCNSIYQCDGTPVSNGTACSGGTCASGMCVP